MAKMITFSNVELRDNVFYIAISVGKETYYNKVYINNITITDLVTGTKIYNNTLDKDTKSLTIEIPKLSTLSLTDLVNIYKVTVTTKGIVDSSVPCGGDIPQVEAVVYDKYLKFKNLKYKLNDYLNSDSCNIPLNLIDDVLRMNYLDMAIFTGDWNNALKLFTDSKKSTEVAQHNCGCNRR